MISSDEMAAAHARDYADKAAMEALVRLIDQFLLAPPSRCGPDARHHLRSAVLDLESDSAHIVRVWD